jgi:hypothetical protein
VQRLKKVIVTTTINPPTESIRLYDAMPDWQLVVATDLKTPTDYALARGIVVTPAMQAAYDPELSELIGWNCIQRRNFAFLWAKDLGADVVAIVDDDNIPMPDWGSDLCVGGELETNFYDVGETPAFDSVGATNEKLLWHRGFPLQLVSGRDYSKRTRRTVSVAIQETFWNGAGDFDAICRLLFAPQCEFDPACFPIASNAMSPFSAASTFLRADLLADYFLFPHVGRMDDIWAAYYLQSLGHRPVFTRPTVFHERSPRDLTREMKLEYLGYEQTLTLVRDLLKDPASIERHLPPRAMRAFERYRSHFSR